MTSSRRLQNSVPIKIIIRVAGASAGARSGVGGLGSGQPADEGGQGPGGSGVPAAAALTPAVHGATARDHADDPNGGSAPPTGVDTASEACPHSDDAAMNLVREAPEVLAQTACATGGEGADEDAFLQTSVLGSVPFVHTMPDAERALDSVPDMAGAGADGHPHRFASSQQHRAWLRDRTVRQSATMMTAQEAASTLAATSRGLPASLTTAAVTTLKLVTSRDRPARRTLALVTPAVMTITLAGGHEKTLSRN